MRGICVDADCIGNKVVNNHLEHILHWLHWKYGEEIHLRKKIERIR